MGRGETRAQGVLPSCPWGGHENHGRDEVSDILVSRYASMKESEAGLIVLNETGSFTDAIRNKLDPHDGSFEAALNLDFKLLFSYFLSTRPHETPCRFCPDVHGSLEMGIRRTL